MPRSIPPDPPSIVDLIRAGALDAELAAYLWLLVEARVPLVVAGEADGPGRASLLGALLAFLPENACVFRVDAADERFEWLPQATELGWPGVASVPADGDPARPSSALLLVDELAPGSGSANWGAVAKVTARAASIGYGLATTVVADSLDAVFARLRQPPVGLVDDELSHLGVVLVVGQNEAEQLRLIAAHYVRPVVRDLHGHLQRLGPAVLATWDPATDSFEHFGWGINPELARRVGRAAGDFEIEVDRRRDHLAGLVTTGVTGMDAVHAALRGYEPARTV